MRRKSSCIQFTAQIAALVQGKDATTKPEKSKTRRFHVIGRKVLAPPSETAFLFSFKTRWLSQWNELLGRKKGCFISYIWLSTSVALNDVAVVSILMTVGVSM